MLSGSEGCRKAQGITVTAADERTCALESGPVAKDSSELLIYRYRAQVCTALADAEKSSTRTAGGRRLVA